jgi:WD40 repeat protein
MMSWKIILLISALILGMVACSLIFKKPKNNIEIGIVSISDDAHYAISTDTSGNIIFWDLRQHQKKIIDTNVNLYGASWIKGTDYYFYQLKNMNVIVKNKDMQAIKFNPGFLSDGSIISSDLQYFIGVDYDWVGYRYDITTNQKITIFHDIPDGKPYTFNFTQDNQNFLMSGDDTSFSLWDTQRHRLLRHYRGNQNKTFSTLSPNGKYVVGGDESANVYVWNTQTGKRVLDLDDLILGEYHPNELDLEKRFDDSVVKVKKPSDFGDNSAANRGIISIKFIDATHFLVFVERINHRSTPYAILYSIDSPRTLKYLPLGKQPFPALQYYERDQAMDTSPSAHVLVIAKETEPGILVYKYDTDKQTLTKTWDSS